ncbi:MAG: efflux RND transporter periplasmic adaptor subunit [Gemmatimonadales bacterium]
MTVWCRTLARRRVVMGSAGMLMAACGHHGSSGDESDSTAAEVPAAVATVAVGEFTETITASGTVEPRAGHAATLGAPAATRIVNVMVSLGQRVQKGQPLIAFEETLFSAALASANAGMAAARQSYARTTRLVDEGIAARKDLDQAAADLGKARADSVIAKRNADLATLRAPFSGVVTRLDAQVGRPVDPAQPLIDIADPAALDVILTVTPAVAARIHSGDPVKLAAGSQRDAAPIASGRVADVAGAVDSATRSVAVRIEVNNAQRTLRIGEGISATIDLGLRKDALTIPSEALVPQGDSFTVFVVDSQGVAHATGVRVGGRRDSTAEITSGLAAGQRVVTRGAFGVEDGAKIVPPKP